MPSPLFSPEEMFSWDQKRTEAKIERVGDTIYHPDSPNPHNASARTRVYRVGHSFTLTKLNRMADRPEAIVNGLLIWFHHKGTEPVTWEDFFERVVDPRLTVADNPTSRKLLHTVLSGLSKIPRSWGKSAAVRFFRGTGKQATMGLKYPGLGVLGKEYDWKQREAEAMLSPFYYGLFSKLFMEDDSPDSYGEEASEIEEEGGNRWAATRKERDDEFFKTLLGILEARGLDPDVEKPVLKAPKPRKAKIFKPGDTIQARNVRDLPSGTHFRWTHKKRDTTRGTVDKPGKRVTRVRTYEGVYVARNKPGSYTLRPVMDDVAFGPKKDCGSHVWDEAEYIGTWSGTTVAAEVKEWKPLKENRIDGWLKEASWH